MMITSGSAIPGLDSVYDRCIKTKLWKPRAGGADSGTIPGHHHLIRPHSLLRPEQAFEKETP
ncbi:hypothetical protein ACWC6I_26195 [Streptomyces sp. NPDC001414]